MYNPFVGNYIMDAFTTEVGAEAILRNKGIIAMGSITGGEVRGTVLSPKQRSASYIGKLGFDRQVNPNLRVRLTGSMYKTNNSASNTLYGGDRAGSRYYYVVENTAATESAQFTSGAINPAFRNKVTAFQVNPFVKFGGLELFGVIERAEGRASAEAANRAIRQYALDTIYRVGPSDELFIAARYNKVDGRARRHRRRRRREPLAARRRHVPDADDHGQDRIREAGIHGLSRRTTFAMAASSTGSCSKESSGSRRGVVCSEFGAGLARPALLVSTMTVHRPHRVAHRNLGGTAVGLERQWSGHADGPSARFGGIRTFTMLGAVSGLSGWLLTLGEPRAAIALLAGATAIIVAAYVAASRHDVDATTEVAALVVVAAGVFAGLGSFRLASGIIALLSLLLVEKSRLHSMVARIDDVSLRAAVRFGVMALVVLPLLPSGPTVRSAASGRASSGRSCCFSRD